MPEKNLSFWPAGLALGCVLLLAGLVTSFFVGVAGAALLGISVAGWMGEARHDG